MRSHVLPFGALIIELGRFCPVECAHCHVESDTTTREKLNEPMLKRAISEFSKLPYARYVYLTGGEPFSHRSLLAASLDAARTGGLKSYVLTSAYWARTIRSASSTLSNLPHVDLVGISYDQYHAPRVPIRSILNAANAFRSRGTSVFLALGSFGPSDLIRMTTISELKKLGCGDLPVVHYPLLARGKGAGLPELQGLELARESAGGCRSIGAPVLTASGKMCACCHTNAANATRNGLPDPLAISSTADVREAAAKFASSRFYRALRTIGPLEIAQFCGINLDNQSRPDVDICNVCDQVRSERNRSKLLRFLSSDEFPEKRVKAIELFHEGGVMAQFRDCVKYESR